MTPTGHWLTCPRDAGLMVPLDHQVIHTLQCAPFRGLWFDRGKLETILAKPHFTTPPHRALADGATGAADLLFGTARAISPNEPGDHVELVSGIVADAASSIVP